MLTSEQIHNCFIVQDEIKRKIELIKATMKEAGCYADIKVVECYLIIDAKFGQDDTWGSDHFDISIDILTKTNEEMKAEALVLAKQVEDNFHKNYQKWKSKQAQRRISDLTTQINDLQKQIDILKG